MAIDVIAVRPERDDERAEIGRIHVSAFGGNSEADLVERLRLGPRPMISLVAEEDGRLVGHILLSPLDVSLPDRRPRALALAPLAVLPDRQRSGIGTRLVTDALKAAQDAATEVVIVLGHPDFYRRFGFSADLAGRLASPYQGPSFMALELVPGALDAGTGTVIYPPAFAAD